MQFRGFGCVQIGWRVEFGSERIGGRLDDGLRGRFALKQCGCFSRQSRPVSDAEKREPNSG